MCVVCGCGEEIHSHKDDHLMAEAIRLHGPQNGLIESTRMMFDWLGHSRNVPEALAMASSMSEATTIALANPNARTGDINGKGNTATMAKAVLEALK